MPCESRASAIGSRAAFATGRVVTAAEYLGRGDECLEARRAALWARRRRGGPGARETATGP